MVRTSSPSSRCFKPSEPKHRRKITQQHTYGNYSYYGSQSPSQYQPNHYEEDDIVSLNDDEVLEVASYPESSQSATRKNPINNTTILSMNDSGSNNPSPIDRLCNSYVNVAPLPIFHGSHSECPITHLSRFNKVCRANNASSVEMMMRIFPVTLDGEAALWYDLNVEPYASLPWEDVKAAFLQAYGGHHGEDRFWEELKTINQANDEAVRSYFLRLQWILKRWPNNGISEGLLKDIFVNGLREDFKNWIIPEKPTSLNEALRLAFAREQAKGVWELRSTEAKYGSCKEPYDEGDYEIRKRMKEFWIESKRSYLMGSSGEDNGEEVKGSDSESESASSGVVVSQEERVEEGMVSGLKMKSQCQCSKHQCWKKFERNDSSSILSQHWHAD